MIKVALQSQTDWSGWRQAARSLVLAGVEPAEVEWAVGGDGVAAPFVTPLSQEASPDHPVATFNVSRTLVALASLAIQAREPERFAVLYSMIWRAHAGESVLEQSDDPDLLLVRRLAFMVRAEAHRMRTLLRFLPMPEAEGTRYLGWFAPAHYVLEANAQLFVRRHATRRFTIVTPDGSADWNGAELRFGPGLGTVADDATLLAWWQAHQDAVLAEARAGTSVPEPEPLDEVPRPLDRPSLGPIVLATAWPGAVNQARDLAWEGVKREAWVCRRCPLYRPATQTVFGEGPADTPVLFVGEQPGDQEDTIGRPFVGPAGQILDRALEDAGIDRRSLYITNAVKHFKFEPRGKRRIHQSPDMAEIQVCRVWLDEERRLVRPRLLVMMGASAARAVLDRQVTIGRERGRPFIMPDGQAGFITVHPSFLLRIPDAERKAQEYRAFVRDLEAIRQWIEREDA